MLVAEVDADAGAEADIVVEEEEEGDTEEEEERRGDTAVAKNIIPTMAKGTREASRRESGPEVEETEEQDQAGRAEHTKEEEPLATAVVATPEMVRSPQVRALPEGEGQIASSRSSGIEIKMFRQWNC